jgi:hypothetical protein
MGQSPHAHDAAREENSWFMNQLLAGFAAAVTVSGGLGPPWATIFSGPAQCGGL